MSITASARIAVAFLALGLTVHRLEAQQGYTTAVHVPRSVLERYVGEYVYPSGNTVTLRLQGDTLIQQAGTRQTIMRPLSETRFTMGPVFTAEFVFEGGDVTQILSSSALEFRLRRKGAPPAPPPTLPVGVRVPRSVLERYAGEYEYIPGQMSRTDLRVWIRLRGDTLFGAVAQEDRVLTPLSETRFQLGTTAIVWEFVTDETNGVTLLMGSGLVQLKARLKKP